MEIQFYKRALGARKALYATPSCPPGRITPVPEICLATIVQPTKDDRTAHAPELGTGKRAWRPVPGWRPVRPYASHEPDFQVPYPTSLPRSPFQANLRVGDA
jgi:hypothetical protein